MPTPGRPPLPSNNTFGAWLRATRGRISGERLGVQAGITQGMISSYERGVKSPERETVEKIAAALAVLTGQDEGDGGEQLRNDALKAWAGIEGGVVEMERIPSDEEMEVIHLYRGIPTPEMREMIRRLMRESVLITLESGEPSDAGPAGS